MGSGKSTLMRIIFRLFQGASVDENVLRAASRYLHDDLLSRVYGLAPEFRLISSHTTGRPPRDGDFPGEYIAHDKEEFADMEAAGEFAWVEKVGNYQYGTLVEDFCACLTRPVIGVFTTTPDTVTDKLQVTWVDQGDVVPVYVNSVLRRERMLRRGGLDEEVVEMREKKNRWWDQKVKHCAIRFRGISNDDDENLHPMLLSAAEIMAGLKR